ncbi:MAG: putative signal peptide protein [Rhizobacter sp.]|nr:putative signal peptide protein [Rhizobacter sp.]
MNASLTRALRRTAAATALAVTALGQATQAHAFDLTIEVTNTKPAMGTVNAAVYASADWMKDGYAVQASMVQAAEKTVLTFKGLAAGKYGVALYQDENRNGKFDTNVVGVPVERYGFSRNAQGRMGPPSFDDAAVDLQADTTIAVALH